MTFDGLLVLGLVLEYMATSGESLSSLAGRLPRLHMRKHEMACPPTLVYRVLDRFRERYSDMEPDCRDGVRVAWEDAWLHVRASNTEPMLRMISESASADRAGRLLEEAVTFARHATHGQGGV
jgi:phosphomannomutase